MRPSYQRTVEPTLEPITLAEAMAFLRVVDTEQEAEITSLIAVARTFVEEQTGRALLEQSWQYVAPSWPTGCAYDARSLVLHRSPLLTIESVKYYPADGGDQATLDEAKYHTLRAPQPGLIVLKSDQDWPSLYDRPDAVEVNFTAGVETAAEVPATLRHAVLLHMSHLYENRLPMYQSIGGSVIGLPYSLQAILESQRVGGWIA